MTTAINRKIFLSYSWKDKDYANQIDSALCNLGFTVSRDIRDVGPWKSIKEFMRSIRNTDYVVIILSANYLKSPNCMFEVNELIKDSGYSSKLFTIVSSDADIYSPFGRAEYVKYWQGMAKDLKSALDSVDIENLGELALDLKRYTTIAGTISEFLDLVSDINNPTTANGIEVLSNLLIEANKLVVDTPESTTNNVPLQITLSACHYADLFYASGGNESMRGKFGIKHAKDTSTLEEFDLPALVCTVRNISDQFRVVDEPIIFGDLTMPTPSADKYAAVGFIQIPQKYRSLEPGAKVTFYEHGKVMLSIIEALFENKITKITVEDNFGFTVSVLDQEIREAEQYFRKYVTSLEELAVNLEKYS